MTLKEFLEEHKKIGIEGIDTRALTRRIRTVGAMKGILSTETDDTRLLLDKVRAYPGLVGRDLIPFVTCGKPYLWKDNGHGPSNCSKRRHRACASSSSTAASNTTSCETSRSGIAM